MESRSGKSLNLSWGQRVDLAILVIGHYPSCPMLVLCGRILDLLGWLSADGYFGRYYKHTQDWHNILDILRKYDLVDEADVSVESELRLSLTEKGREIRQRLLSTDIGREINEQLLSDSPSDPETADWSRLLSSDPLSRGPS